MASCTHCDTMSGRKTLYTIETLERFHQVKDDIDAHVADSRSHLSLSPSLLTCIVFAPGSAYTTVLEGWLNQARNDFMQWLDEHQDLSQVEEEKQAQAVPALTTREIQTPSTSYRFASTRKSQRILHDRPRPEEAL